MRRRHVLAPETAPDLVQIWRYIKESSEKIADRVEAAIRDQIVSLAKDPSMGHRRKDLTNGSSEVLSSSRTSIVYRPDTKPLHVVAILQGRRDVRQVLKDRL